MTFLTYRPWTLARRWHVSFVPAASLAGRALQSDRAASDAPRSETAQADNASQANNALQTGSAQSGTPESSNPQATAAQRETTPERAAARHIAWLPAVDVRETADRFVVRADLPGVDVADIEITAEQGVLTLRGERRFASSDSARFARRESAAGHFLRRFELPESVQTDAITATQLNGVLEVVIPKQPKPEARRIKIEAA
ncbi:MAG TPA: Hsp20/alpha crystallin family protein [Steroidobacteraceae bacterium]|nr:Hsp20/alpha crystallin family protein [Steroidobacteraceae bacterium]